MAGNLLNVAFARSPVDKHELWITYKTVRKFIMCFASRGDRRKGRGKKNRMRGARVGGMHPGRGDKYERTSVVVIAVLGRVVLCLLV